MQALFSRIGCHSRLFFSLDVCLDDATGVFPSLYHLTFPVFLLLSPLQFAHFHNLFFFPPRSVSFYKLFPNQNIFRSALSKKTTLDTQRTHTQTHTGKHPTKSKQHKHPPKYGWTAVTDDHFRVEIDQNCICCDSPCMVKVFTASTCIFPVQIRSVSSTHYSMLESVRHRWIESEHGDYVFVLFCWTYYPLPSNSDKFNLFNIQHQFSTYFRAGAHDMCKRIFHVACHSTLWQVEE